MNKGKEKIFLTAVGDIMLGDLPGCFGFGVGSQVPKRGIHYLFDKTRTALCETDILFGNLEAVLSDKGVVKWWVPTLYLRGRPEMVEALKVSGFNIMSVANNHMMQHGPEAFLDTIGVLEKGNISPLGLLDEKDYHSKPVIKTIKDIRLGFLGYSLQPERYVPNRVLYCQGKIGEIRSDIRKLKQEVDRIVISLHWGDEFIQRPSPAQQIMARSMIDEGADIILGHHSHVIQGIERYRGALIAYSLGNFIFESWFPKTSNSIILKVGITKDKIGGIEVMPLAINDIYQPELLDGPIKRNFILNFKKLSEQLGEGNYSAELYAEELRRCYKQYRKTVWKHYLMNIGKFRLLYLLQLLPIIITRRILKKFL